MEEKQLAIVVLTALYNLSEAQQAQTGNIIDSMVANKIITKQRTAVLGKVVSVGAKILRTFLWRVGYGYATHKASDVLSIPNTLSQHYIRMVLVHACGFPHHIAFLIILLI